MNKIITMIVLMLVSTAVFATIPKDTLHVERIITVPNGTSSGIDVATTTFIKRYYTPADCDTEALLYNAQATLVVNGRNISMLTIAKCEAINHSIYQ